MKKFIISVFSALVASLFMACSSSTTTYSPAAVENLTPTSDTSIAIYFGDNVYDKISGKNVSVKIDTFKFDVFKDRRELLRKFYSLCTSPKVKAYLPNSGQRSFSLYVDDPDKKGELLKISERLTCEVSADGSLFSLGGLYPKEYKRSADGIVLTEESFKERGVYKRNFNDMDGFVRLIANDRTACLSVCMNEVSEFDKKHSRTFNKDFLKLIDIARIQAMAKNTRLNPPSKMVKLMLGIKNINPKTGKEDIIALDELSFNVNDDRRNLVKAVYEKCANPNEKIQSYVQTNLADDPIVSVYYNLNGSKEAISLRCNYDHPGTVTVHDVSLSGGEPSVKGELKYMGLLYKDILYKQTRYDEVVMVPKKNKRILASAENSINSFFDKVAAKRDEMFNIKTNAPMSELDEFIDKVIKSNEGSFSFSHDFVKIIDAANGVID